MNRKELLKERDNNTSKETKISLVLTHSWSLPNISKVAHKLWNILSIKKAFKEIFQNEPVTAFRHDKNLKELMGGNKIEYNKVKKHNILKKEKCFSCSVNNRTLCCKQVFLHQSLKVSRILNLT